MEQERFDSFTRLLSGVDSPRRQALRALGAVLLGGAFTGVAARLGLTERAEAKAKKHKAKSKRQRTSDAGRNRKEQLQAEAKKKKKRKKKPPAPPAPDAFACPAAARCQVARQNTANGTVDLESCNGDGGARALCDEAMKTAAFRTLGKHLLTTGFALTGDPAPLIDFYEVREDGTKTEDVIILRFVKRASGETALLRYGEDPDGQHTATYALVQQGDTPLAILSVNDNGTVVSTPVEASASRAQRRAAQRSVRAAAASGENPYEGQADALCRECPVVCKAAGSIECGLLVLLFSLNPAAALILAKICEKPAEAACEPFCNSMIEPLLEDDPKNCGACGHACDAGEECCAGQCKDTLSDPDSCGACGHQCPSSAPTCCDGLCVDLDTDHEHCGRCRKQCEPEEECQQGTCQAPCQAPCGDVCCEADETCLEDPGGPPWIWRCCPNELNVNGHCCDGNKTVCGPAPGRPAYEKYCCAEGSICCGNGTGCCGADSYCCASSGQCLPKNLGPWMECGNGCGRIQYDQCCAGYACSNQNVCSDNRCCPRDYHRCGDFCCRN